MYEGEFKEYLKLWATGTVLKMAVLYIQQTSLTPPQLLDRFFIQLIVCNPSLSLSKPGVLAQISVYLESAAIVLPKSASTLGVIVDDQLNLADFILPISPTFLFLTHFFSRHLASNVLSLTFFWFVALDKSNVWTYVTEEADHQLELILVVCERERSLLDLVSFYCPPWMQDKERLNVCGLTSLRCHSSHAMHVHGHRQQSCVP